MSGAMPQIACANERAAPIEWVAQRHSSTQSPSTLGAGPISGKPSDEYGKTPLYACSYFTPDKTGITSRVSTQA